MSSELIGYSAALSTIKHATTLLAPLPCPLWFTGESGVGKRFLSQHVHSLSPLKNQPFTLVNCSTISTEQQLPTLESALNKTTDSTLAIADAQLLTPNNQYHLMELLGRYKDFNCRFIITSQPTAAPLFSLPVLIENRIAVPALRERTDDITALTEYFLQQSALELDTTTKRLDSTAQEVLTNFSWPNNIRQLQNCCRWLTLMVNKENISRADLPPDILSVSQKNAEQWAVFLSLWAQQKLEQGEKNILSRALPLFEHTLIKAALKHSGGRRQEAAKLLGYGRNTLTRKLHEFSISSTQDSE